MAVDEKLKNRVMVAKTALKITQAQLSELIGVKSTYLSDMINGRVPATYNVYSKLEELIKKASDDTQSLSHKWYGDSTEKIKISQHLIPFYDDTSTIGGKNELNANVNEVSQPTEYIDTGDWFRDATAAIRHYGESMDEYPSGCILAIREVKDRNLIVPGRDYVIETCEYRVTKRLQRGSTSEYITAYSTNQETYKDGRLIHDPFDIPLKAINKLYMVLGYVVKKSGGTIIYNNHKSN